MANSITITQYLTALTPERKKAIQALRKVIKQNLDPAYKEIVQSNAIGYVVPHKVFPAGYHCNPDDPLPYVGIASQKNHIGLYLFCAYMNPQVSAWFQKAWKASGKKLDMGKSCVRFKKLEDIPLDVVGEVIRRTPAKEFIRGYEASLESMASRRAKKPVSKRKPAKKKTVREKVTRKVAAKTIGKKKAAKKTTRRMARKR